MKTDRNNKKAFTLVELLVVISIIALLLAILMPSLQKARAQAKQVLCSSNLKQIFMGMTFYAEDNNGYLPAVARGPWPGDYPDPAIDGVNPLCWSTLYPDYLDDTKVFTCPASKYHGVGKWWLIKYQKNGLPGPDPEKWDDWSDYATPAGNRYGWIKFDKVGENVEVGENVADYVSDNNIKFSPKQPASHPLIWDHYEAVGHPNGKGVNFMDGHVGFVRFGSKEWDAVEEKILNKPLLSLYLGMER